VVRPFLFSWAEVPFFRILIWTGAALLLPPIFIERSDSWIWGVPLLPTAHLLLLGRLKGRFRFRWLTGLSTGVCISTLIWINHSLHFSAYQARLPPECTFQVCLLQVDGVADTSHRQVRVLCSWILADTSDYMVRYGSRIRLETDFAWRAPPPGTFIVVRNARSGHFRNLRNPHAFNTEGYARNKGIVGRLKTRSEQIITAHLSSNLSLRQRAQRLSKQVCRVIYTHLPQREAALACAILLGERQGMDEETEQAFSGSGLIHIMAVSGMHVGIFYLMCSWLLFSILRLPKKAATLVILLLLWTYALLTGLSPSVVRASGMFSLASAGKLWNRHASSYNLMSAAAFFQVWLDTRLPAQPGFLLSYAAVFGILFLHPRLFSLYWTKNKWLDKVWELCSLSLSAQWFTLPFVLYYFHTFPVYFLPANLLVVPLAAPALIGTLLLVFLSLVPFLAQLFAYPLSWLLMGINEMTAWISALPYAQSSGWYWTQVDGLIAGSLVVLIPLGWLIQNRWARQATITAGVAWYGLTLTHLLMMWESGDFHIYEGYLRGSAAIRVGRQAWVWSDPADGLTLAATDPVRREGVKRITVLQNQGVVVVRWQNKTALWLSQPNDRSVDRLPEADILILECRLKSEAFIGFANKYPIMILGSGYKPYFCQQIRLLTGRDRHSCRCISEEGGISLWNISISKPALKRE